MCVCVCVVFGGVFGLCLVFGGLWLCEVMLGEGLPLVVFIALCRPSASLPLLLGPSVRFVCPNHQWALERGDASLRWWGADPLWFRKAWPGPADPQMDIPLN